MKKISYLVILLLIVSHSLVRAEGISWQPSDVRMNTNTPGYNDSQYVDVAATGSNVYVVWEDSRNGNEDIYLNYSNDNGSTWQASDIRLDTDTAGAKRSLFPKIATSGSNVYAVWKDNRNGNLDIYLNYSNDYGHTWQASDIRLDTDDAGSNYSYNPIVAASGNKVYVVWFDQREGSTSAMNIFCNYSADAGANWLATDKRIDHTAGEPYEMNLYADGSNVYVAWDEVTNSGQNIYFTHSTNSGDTWPETDTKINHNDDGTCGTPRMAVQGSDIHITWDHSYNYTYTIRYSSSTDGGVTWPDSDTILAYDRSAEVTASDAIVHVLYPDNDQLLMKSKDSVTDWPTTPVVVRNYDVKSYSRWSVTAQNSNVFAVWEDQLCLDQSIFFNYSSDSGQTFMSYPVPVNTTSCSAAMDAIALKPRMAVSDSYIYVAWQDGRNTHRDVYLRVGKLPTQQGPGGISGVFMLLLN